ncbi:MAG: acyl-CoA dehydrogenase [Deltaproteobacteria bacterium]|jgi:alkylation response protein AidB-like acyl-CoA dehydrogenase|nr:acyl-CoA dehydrogenase [Deltaproteobacteria bacterium]
MDFRFTDEQEELREMARAFLSEVSGSEQVRAAMASELGHDPEVWKRIGSELGWPSVHIPEEYGGLGLGDVELVALMETMGESVLCSPFFATVCLGANALLVAGSEEQKRARLPAIAEGQVTATLAHAERGGGWDSADVTTTYRREADEIRLSGTKRFVVDGHVADLVVVSARAEGSAGREGLALFLVPGDAPGLVRTLLPTMDQTRHLAELELAEVRLPAEARLGEAGAEALDEILQRAAVALAAEQVGGAQRCLEMSVAYAKEREQYGRPIGSFQAIKHKCADMMVKVEAARSALYYAACVAAESGESLALAASMAKSAASDAYFFNAGAALQIFGGVGFTWEYDIHLYFKRARSSTALLGDVVHHRERIARALGL